MRYIRMMLCLWLLLAAVPVAAAAEATEEAENEPAATTRFRPIFSDDEYNYSLDTLTIKLIPHPYKAEQLIDVWLKLEHNASDLYEDSAIYILQHYYMRQGSPEQQLLSEIIVNSDENSSSEQRAVYSESNWESLIPDTSEELCYREIVSYVDKRFNSDTGKKKKKFLGLF